MHPPDPNNALRRERSRQGGSSASVGAAMSGAVIIARLIGDDTAQAGDIVVRSRSPVFALCRALLAAGANPNSRLECFRGSLLALTVKTIGTGAKLTIKENDWVGPKVVPYEPFSRDRVGRHTRQNGEPAPPPLADHPLAEGIAAKEVSHIPPNPQKLSVAEFGEIGSAKSLAEVPRSKTSTKPKTVQQRNGC
jgi:hypothetical protein